MAKRYSKAVAAVGASVVGLLALFGVDASSTVDTIAAVLVALTPAAVYFAPPNARDD